MRNLKRVLSLALALVMMLGMMVIGANAASADFADADEITYTEAVDVMAALGIIEGYNGSFNPNGTLTREQAAKIICYMLVGPATAEKLAGTDTFTDVAADRWSAPFVSYCANLGIIAGVGDNAFDPEGKLTGVAFAKMLLVALGNDPVACGYVGGNWATSVAVDAMKAGLDLDGVALADPLTREQASQMAWNAMNYGPETTVTKYQVMGISAGFLANAGTVTTTEYATKAAAIAAAAAVDTAGGSSDPAVYNSDYVVEEVVTKTVDNTKTLAYQNFGVRSATGVVSSNQATVAGQKYSAIGGSNYAIETGKDLIGHNVTVYYKTTYTSASNPGKTYSIVDNSKVVVVEKALEAVTADEVKALFGIDAVSTGDVNTIVDYVISGTDTPIDTNSTKYDVAAGEYIITNKAIAYYKTETTTIDKFTVVIDDAAKGYYTVTDNTTSTVVEKVAAAAADCVAKVANKVDWVGMVKTGSSASTTLTVTKVGEFYTVSDVAAVTGKVTKVTATKIYVDGAEYVINTDDLSAQIGAMATGTTAIATLAGTPDFANEYKFFIDGDGEIFAYISTDETVTSDPALIVPVMLYQKSSTSAGDAYGNAGTTTYTYWIQGVDMEGKEVNLQVTWTEAKTFMTQDNQAGYPDSGNAAWNASTAANQWAPNPSKFGKLYTYTVSEDSTLKADVADFTAVTTTGTVACETSSGTVAATAKKAAASNSKSFYLNDTYTVLYFTGYGKDLKAVVEAGKSSVIDSGDIFYGKYASGVTSGNNYELTYVIKSGSPSVDVPSTDIVYVAANFNSTSKVPYTTSSGTIATGYAQTVYINGVKTDIITKAADGKDTGNSNTAVQKGFYTYTKDSVTGLYTLSATSTNVKTAVDDYTLYQGLLSSVDGACVDVDVTGVTVVNTTNITTVPTDATQLAVGTETELALVKNADGAIVLIYVVAASTRS